MVRTRKVKSSGRFKARYGTRVRAKISEVEEKQKKKQLCPFCKKPTAKRLASGIWKCKHCKKKFAGQAYYLE